jgi:TolB-like protein/DNA-binding winged helix-turn-helix (wHTH) protein/Tfp pilus assembly protein PilF
MAASTSAAPGIIRFGVFEYDARAGELRKGGVKTRLEGQPLAVLELLLARPGEIVTREELQQRLWPADTFVDFEHSINAAVKRLREALDDSATSPRYIETLPRRGYRFIYPVSNSQAGSSPTAPEPRARRPKWATLLLLVATAVGLIATIPAVRELLPGRRMPGKTLRVAVLPLRNLSGDPQQDYWAAGMTEMLITELGSIPDLQVWSHQSVLRYAQSTKTVPQIAEELGVDAVIEGTVQQFGSRVRVTVNFVQARPEGHLLAKSFEKDLPDVFRVQEEIAGAVSEALHLRRPEPTSASTRQFSPDAIFAYLHGTYLIAKGREIDRDQARTDFLRAIEIDPDFARPYAALALMYAHGGAARGGPPGEGRKLTREWAQRALQLDPSLAEPHAALAWILFSDRKFKEAEQEFQSAVKLNPSFALARTWYAQFLGTMRRYPEAFAQTDIALRLAPGFPEVISHAVEPYVNGGRVDEAIVQWKGVVESQPDYWVAHYFLANAYMKKGLYAQALNQIQETIRIDGRSRRNLAVLATIYAKSGDTSSAKTVLQEALEIKEGGASVGLIAAAYAALGQRDQAMELLEEAYRSGRPAVVFMDIDSLEPDPRYHDLRRRVGLPD